MPTIILLVIGVYVLIVGLMGHAPGLIKQLEGDLPGFIPWIIAIAILGALAVDKNTEKLGKPLLGLIFLGILVKDWPNIKANSIAVYNAITPQSVRGALP